MDDRSQRKPKLQDVHYQKYTTNKYGDPIRGPKIAKTPMMTRLIVHLFPNLMDLLREWSENFFTPKSGPKIFVFLGFVFFLF